MIKTILIVATYHCDEVRVKQGSGHVIKTITHYKYTLYGQTTNRPKIELISYGQIDTENGYDDLISECREKFCKYYNCDDFNITHIDNITNIG